MQRPTSEKESDSSLSYMDIQGLALTLVVLGFDSVSSTLSFALFLLACHPECCLAAQHEIDTVLDGQMPDYNNIQHLPYLEMCINEILRMFPPGVFQDRVCNQECVIQGVKIMTNQMVVIPVVGVHYDPTLWSEPEAFDPTRFNEENKIKRHPHAFIPSGQGPRNCLGRRFALVSMKICLATVLQRMTPVPSSKTVYPVSVVDSPLRAKDGLWVKFIKRVK